MFFPAYFAVELCYVQINVLHTFSAFMSVSTGQLTGFLSARALLLRLLRIDHIPHSNSPFEENVKAELKPA